MKIVGILSVFLFFYMTSFAEKEVSTESGRYQVIAASFGNPVGERSKPTIVEIDTITGRVWSLERTNGPVVVERGKTTLLIEGWNERESRNLVEAMRHYEVLSSAQSDSVEQGSEDNGE